MFIGREREIAFLEDQYHRDGGSLVVLYGRRRIGKTETLHAFCEGKPHLFYTCIETQDEIQLSKFSERILRSGHPAASYLQSFSDWESAFSALLETDTGTEKKLIVIDEFPYLCRANPSVPSILQKLWDESFRHEKICLILCGSSMSFIEKELLAEKNPLYARATGIYKMQEMTFAEASRFFPNYTPKEKMMAYGILGGIPHYLKQFSDEKSIRDNIRDAILTRGSILYSETEFLLRQELRETSIYNSLIQTIAAGSTKLGEISTKSMVQSTAKTSIYLKTLVELGLVEKEFPVTASEAERAKASRGIYRLSDAFFRFYYAYAFPYLSELESGDAEGVLHYIVEPDLSHFCALPFEKICLEYVRACQRNGMLPFRYDKAGRWWGKTTVRRGDETEPAETEIDLLAVSKSKKQYLVGECKFKNADVSYGDYLDAKAKLSELQGGAKFYYMLFSAADFDDALKKEAKASKRLFLRTAADITEVLR